MLAQEQVTPSFRILLQEMGTVLFKDSLIRPKTIQSFVRGIIKDFGKENKIACIKELRQLSENSMALRDLLLAKGYSVTVNSGQLSRGTLGLGDAKTIIENELFLMSSQEI